MNALILVAALGLLSADWDNLKEITRDRYYTVALSDSRCVSGHLTSSDDQLLVLDSVTIKLGSVTIKQADVVRISDIPFPSQYPVYSGRSSWTDVQTVRPRRTEFLQIVTNRGELLKWKNPNVSDDSIAFEAATLPKADVKTISFLRFKPMTKTEQWYDTESATILAPRLWFHGLMLGKISVTLYNSAMTEDNSKLGCR